MPRTKPVICAALMVCVGMASDQPAFGLRLPDVAPLPAPVLPQWIVEAAPIGQASSSTQVRIRFATPIVPLTGTDPSLEKPILDHFSIYPEMPGAFRIVSPRLVVFDTYRPFPIATRLRVNVSAGLHDLARDRLTRPLVWTFETEALSLNTSWFGSYSPAMPATLYANTSLDIRTLVPRVTFTDVTDHAIIPVAISIKDQKLQWRPIPLPEPDPNGPTEDDGSEGGSYTITPLLPLRDSTVYQVDVQAGVRALVGNLPLAKPESDRTRTVDPLRFLQLEMYDSNAPAAAELFASGAVKIDFNNQINASTLAANVTLSPTPRPGFPLFASDDPQRFNDAALMPDTTYNVRIGPGVTDESGQRLGVAQTATFTTGDLSPDFAAPVGYRIIPARARWSLSASVLNPPDSEMSIFSRALDMSALLTLLPPPTPPDPFATPRPFGDPAPLLPETTQWQNFTIRTRRNSVASMTIPIDRGQSGFGVLAYGVLAGVGYYQIGDDVMRISRAEFSGVADFTDIGLFAQVLRENGIFRVHHLHDGSPIAGASVELYDVGSGIPAKPCATGTTDAGGLLVMDAASVANCIRPFTLPQLFAAARDGNDWTTVRLDVASPYTGASGTSFWPTAEIERNGWFMADRGIYRPGETATLEAYAYFGRDGVLSRDAGTQYAITLGQPDGTTTSLGDRTTDAGGAFSLMVPFAPHVVPGSYKLTASAANGNTFQITLNVQEFKAAQYSVDVKSDSPDPIAGDAVSLTALGRYSYDAPLAHGAVSWHVVTSRGYHWFDWGYTMGREWISPDSPPSPPPADMRASGLLDASGAAIYRLATAAHLAYWTLYDVDVQASDGRNVPTSARDDVLVAPTSSFIGLSANDTASVAQPIVVRVIAFGFDKKNLVGKGVHLDLQRQSVDDRSNVSYATVASAEVISAQDARSVTFAAQPPGEYIIRANFAGAANADSETDTVVNVAAPVSSLESRPVPAPNATSTPDPLEIAVKTWGVSVGSQQHVTLKTAYPDADVFVGVIGRRLLWSQTLRVTQGSAEVSFTVTPEMEKGAAVEAMAVRRGTDRDGAAGPPGETLSATRWTNLGAFQSQRSFKASVKPAFAVITPGGRQTLHLSLFDDAGKPVEGRFTVMVDSDDVLRVAWAQLPGMNGANGTGFNTYEDPTAYGDNRPSISLAPPLTPLHWSSCCGAATPAPSSPPIVWNPSNPPRVIGAITMRTPPAPPPTARIHFRPLAYFAGAVRTDARGHATVSFSLPDDLTTWRARVVAVPDAAEMPTDASYMAVVEAETTFVARKPLMANPALPNFARPGDRFGAGVIVTNATDARGDVRVSGSLTGPLTFVGSGSNASTVMNNLAAGDTGTRFFDVQTRIASAARLRFDAVLGTANDAFVIPFSVIANTSPEDVVETGATTGVERIPFAIDRRSVPGSGRLDITLANSIVPDVTLPAQSLIADQDLDWLEPVISRLVAAASVQRLSTGSGSAVARSKIADEGALELGRLSVMQRYDGGFGFVPFNQVSDPYLSAYAAEALSLAQRAGFATDPIEIDRLEKYLNGLIDNPTQWRYCLTASDIARVRLDSMLALNELGAPRTDHLAEVYAFRVGFDLAGLARLAHLLAATPGWTYQARLVFRDLAPFESYTGRSVFVNLPGQWSWLDSGTVAQAELLEAAIAGSANAETQDRIIRGLLARRDGDAWEDPHSTADALSALADYADAGKSLDGFMATATLADRQVGSVTFDAGRRASSLLSVQSASLPPSSGDLLLAVHGRGDLHYVAVYSYMLAGDLPALDRGLRVIRTLQPLDANGIAGAPLAESGSTPLALSAGRLYEIAVRVLSPPELELDHLVIVERLAAGLEPVNGELASENATLPRHDTRDYYWGEQTVFRDRIVWHLSESWSGTTVTYIARAVTGGSFDWPGADAHLEFAPEEFGRSAPETLRIDR
jgi:uncharacterized protein YfaS (alpha-2-macroglobulin family)